MPIKFAVRPENDDFEARYSNSGKTPGLAAFDPAQLVRKSDAGAIGGFSYQFGTQRQLFTAVYNAQENFSTTGAFSILIRYNAAALTGGTIGLWDVLSTVNRFFAVSCGVNTTNIVLELWSDDGNTNANVNFAHGGLNNLQWYDILITWDGTNSANSFKCYLDGVLIGQNTPGFSWAGSDKLSPNIISTMSLGVADTVDLTYMDVNEFVVWDEVIDPTSVGLVNGTGSLNGAARTSFVDIEAMDVQSETILQEGSGVTTEPIFPSLSIPEVLQVGEKFRINATETFAQIGLTIDELRVQTESGAGFISILTDNSDDWFLDWSYLADGTKTVSLRASVVSGDPVLISKDVNVLTEENDNLFSKDIDITPYEPDVLRFLPKDKAAFTHVHRVARDRIMQWIYERGFLNSSGDKLQASDIKDTTQVKDWSKFMTLRLIFESMSNAIDDIFHKKAMIYKNRETTAQRLFLLSIDTTGDGEANDWQYFANSGRIVRR